MDFCRSGSRSKPQRTKIPLGRGPILCAPPSLPFLCAFFCNARAQKCLESYPTLKIVNETQKTGASRGDDSVVTGLADCECAIRRLAALGGVSS
jgi:hypothetical protein